MLKSHIRPVASALVLAAMSMTAAAVVSTPAVAQKNEEAPKPPKPSRKAQKDLGEVQKLLGAEDYEGAKAKIAEMEAKGTLTEEDLYYVTNFKLQAGLQLKDDPLVESALEGMVANKYTPASEVPKIQNNLVALALQAENYPKAIERLNQVLETNPNNVEAILNIGRIHYQQGDYANAIASFQRGIETANRNGERPEEDTYKLLAQTAMQAKDNAVLQSAMVGLVTTYPNPTNWRDALVLYRDQQGITDPMILDSYRLQLANNALAGERDYIEMAELAHKRGLPGETKAVIEKGLAENVFEQGKAAANELLNLSKGRAAQDLKDLPGLEKEAQAAKTGDLAAATVGQGWMSHGNYAKAVEFYKLGLEKGVRNPDEANLHYGIALVGAGRPDEAKAAFAAVGGNLKQLADLWAIHAAQKAGGGQPQAADGAAADGAEAGGE